METKNSRNVCWQLLQKTGPQGYAQQVLPHSAEDQARMAILTRRDLHTVEEHFWNTIATLLPDLEQATRLRGGGDRQLYRPYGGANWHILMDGYRHVLPLLQASAVTMDLTHARARRLLERLEGMYTLAEEKDRNVLDLPIENTCGYGDAIDEFDSILHCMKQWQKTGVQKLSA